MTSSRSRCISYLRRDGIYAILDTGILPPEAVLPWARRLAGMGIRVFQLRAKHLTDCRILDLALRLRSVLRRRVLIINDRIDIAFLSNADGVHLGQDDVPAVGARKILGAGKVVGLSAGKPSEIRRAVRMAPDYISLGPAFATHTKSDAGKALGPEMLGCLGRNMPRKFLRVAVGGITADNVGIILRCGIDAVAAAGQLLPGGKRDGVARRFVQAIKKEKAVQRRSCAPVRGARGIRRAIRIQSKAGGG